MVSIERKPPYCGQNGRGEIATNMEPVPDNQREKD
jgi:hypothetical protein